MKAQWFIHREGAVLGPFTPTDVDKQIASGHFNSECLVWARGSNEWLPMSEWKSLVAKMGDTSKATPERVWYCDSGAGQPAGPLTQNELVEHLKGLNRWDIVTLWGTGLLKWLPLFEVPEVMDLVGISRREHPRAPLLGSVALTPSGSATPAQMLASLTVSVGGIGVKNAGFLQRGDRVQIAIKSRDIPTVIHVTGEVLYVSRVGEAGIRFTELSPEGRALLSEHIRRFHDSAISA